MSITSDNSKRSVTSINNPTDEQIASFFGFDVKDRYERVICISTAINESIGMINHSIVTTRNRVSCLKENKRICWNMEVEI